MTQDQLIILLFRILLIADLASVILFLVIYTALASWWRDMIGRTIAIKDILLGAAFIPSILSLFFQFNRLSSRVAAWFDIGVFGGIAAVMLWRCAVWIRVHNLGEKMTDIPEHEQKVTHSYLVHYPEHAPRKSDPHLKDFQEWKRRRKDSNTYYCDFAHDHRGGDTSECDNEHPLEAHHKVVELAMLNEIDFALLEEDFPGISDPETAGAWIDSDKNLVLLCSAHHRGPMGVHVASYSDFTSESYVRHLIQGAL